MHRDFFFFVALMASILRSLARRSQDQPSARCRRSNSSAGSATTARRRNLTNEYQQRSIPRLQPRRLHTCGTSPLDAMVHALNPRM